MFDSLRFDQRLRGAGADPALAEAFAGGISEALIAPLIERLATTEDLNAPLVASQKNLNALREATQNDLNGLREEFRRELAAKGQRLEAKIEATFARARIEAVCALVVFASLIVALNRLLRRGETGPVVRGTTE